MDARVGLWRRLSAKELMLLNYGVGEDLRAPWTARRSNQSILKEINLEYSLEDWCWSWSSNILVTWCKEPTHWKRPWFWERLKAGGEDDRGWDGWMASPTWWTWVWVSSGSWRWTGRLGMLQSMALQRVGHDWVTELNWTEPVVVTKVNRYPGMCRNEVSPIGMQVIEIWSSSLLLHQTGRVGCSESCIGWRMTLNAMDL